MTDTADTTGDALDLVIGRVFRRGTSLLTPSIRRWTPERLDDLHARLARASERAADPTGRPATFEQRWQRMLVRAERGVVVLAAELLYVHLVYPVNVAGSRKRALLTATLERAPDAPAWPRTLDLALDRGIAPAGQAYARRRLSQLAWLAGAMAYWRRLAPAQRRAALRDPLAAAAAFRRPGAAAQRSAVLVLLHADAFVPITSAGVRRAILRAFASHVPAGVTDGDVALAAVRDALVPVFGAEFSFFDAPVLARWHTPLQRT